MPASLLITQCLQNDFAQPIGRFDPIPNRLHVGFHEALRLMGESPSEGPVARTMRWAHATSGEELGVIHIRDWHDPEDPVHRDHLERFGLHCVRNTRGADFVFPLDDADRSRVAIVDSLSLNDFVDTNLEALLAPYAGQRCRVGIVGVWTEAKVSFLCYELATRYPTFELAICSALTASSSRSHHFASLDRLERILGVRIHDSVGEFLAFLGGEEQQAPLLGLHDSHPAVIEHEVSLDPDDRTLVRYLFRDCRTVRVDALSGGYSGNAVLAAESFDLHGHEQVPHVVKIGPRQLMGQERTSFERIQEVLGNAAPHIGEFADFGERGAIKYRYASMTGDRTTTFQKRYMGGAPLDQIRGILDAVFREQLGRLYKAATLERCDLLEHYGFSSRWAPSVREKVEAILGHPATERTLEVLPGLETSNVCSFYENTLAHPASRPGSHCYQAFVHGDLNGANIVLDGHDNVWLIDFFHTRRAHVLMDLIKLENDLLYIFTPIDSDEDLREACKVTDALMNVQDLAAPLPQKPPSHRPQLVRVWETLRTLRSYYPALIHADRSPYQVWVGALRYAVHTGSFYESNDRQKKWALYAAGRLAEAITRELKMSTRLRVDWLDPAMTLPGRIGLTLLPGRKDYDRSLERDLAALREDGVDHILCLAPEDELARYGVGDLLEQYEQAGFSVHHLPILDQKVCSIEDMKAALQWVEEAIAKGGSVLMHCVGGLGRSGMAGASFLRARGASADDALHEVRRARSLRAVETPLQEAFVRAYQRA